MLLYAQNGAIVINSIHVASIQILPVVAPGTNRIERVELHLTVSGGKIIHIIPENLSRKLAKYFTNPLSVQKLSEALLNTWMEVMKEPSPNIAISLDDLVERVLEKAR